MASLIHFNLHDPEWILPDRNTIPHDVAFFQNLRDLLVSICHRRGAFAIGGMTALYPDRNNPELNARALAVLEKERAAVTTPWWFGERIGHADIAVACALRFTGEAHPALFDARYPALQAHAAACEALPPFQEIVQPLAPPSG